MKGNKAFRDLKLPFSVVREQDTKIKDSNSGRIDLFVSNEEHYIVLENKIKSDINKVDSDSDDCTQLNRYVKYVEHKNSKEEKEKKRKSSENHRFFSNYQ